MFLHDVRWEADKSVEEESVKAAADSTFVVGADIVELRKRLMAMLEARQCDEHLDEDDWEWRCVKCMAHTLMGDWRLSAGWPAME
jgi:Zn finger protein HypA/HybF involved in hydrogenase expression